MEDLAARIAQMNEDEARKVLLLVLARYRELYPYGQLETFWVEYGRSIYEEFDCRIRQLEMLKKRIGPVLLSPTKRRIEDLKIPPFGNKK